MSNIEKQALRKRYSAKPTPKCDICGAKMTIQRMSGSRVTYGCSGAIYDETGCHYAEGRSLADDHYEQSRVTVTDESDPDVLALLDELEAKDKQIAELEAREVKLPKLKMLCDYLSEVTHREREDILLGVKLEFHRELQAAGIRIKGEQ
ncbi:TPA: ead/Ea22-like family protein [Enterobacter hormaechei subsp. xiangfangensis]|nr:ead/Ea22-like family protein [Enterobacter hormaechei subsp. xiangfangensis]